jgi:hypothetical protein
VGKTSEQVAAGDLNGDGLPDVVLTRITFPTAHITHPIGIFLSDGHGGFRDGSSMWSGPPARTEFGRQIVIAEFNGDHRNDISVAEPISAPLTGATGTAAANTGGRSAA